MVHANRAESGGQVVQSIISRRLLCDFLQQLMNQGLVWLPLFGGSKRCQRGDKGARNHIREDSQPSIQAMVPDTLLFPCLNRKTVADTLLFRVGVGCTLVLFPNHTQRG